MTGAPAVAVFRPDDGRLSAAAALLESLGADPVADPMLDVEPTGERPREDADVTILTSKTGAELLDGTDWQPPGRLSTIGESTAAAARSAGFEVDIVPETYSSAGLVDRLEGTVDGARVEVARSDHGSAVLLNGLEAAGAYLHETILYRLERPPTAGRSTEQAAAGQLDGALFTSSLTVEHFLAAAEQREVHDAAVEGLTAAVVGAIGVPTRETAEAAGIAVDVVPDEASVDALARAVCDRLETED